VAPGLLQGRAVIPAPFVTAVRTLLADGWKRGALVRPVRQLRPPADRHGWVVWQPWNDEHTGETFEVDILTDHGHGFVFDACALGEVLDLLVAVGILPVEQSSAYRTGFLHAVGMWETAGRPTAEAALVAS
jgi:hypothetical protein